MKIDVYVFTEKSVKTAHKNNNKQRILQVKEKRIFFQNEGKPKQNVG